MPESNKSIRAPLPQAHAGTLRQFVRHARATGLDLDACLDGELREWTARADDQDMLPAHVIVDVLEVTAAVSQRPDLGIAFAAWSNLRGFGPLSLLWDHCPTLRDLVRIARTHLNLENAALGTAVEEDGDEVALRHFVAVPARYGSRQFIEATLALDVCLARMMFGGRWAPLRLELAHSPPRSDRYRRSFFACPIDYGASRSALVVRREDMDRVQPNANLPMLSYLEKHLLTVTPSHPRNLTERVDHAIAAHLPGGHASLDQIAAVLAISRRTLQRRLGEQGTSFAAIQQNVRRRAAIDYFASEPRPNLADLAYRLGFGDAVVAGRFLRDHVKPARALKQR